MIILLVLSYFVFKENMISINVSTILGIIAPFISLSTPAHVGVLEQIGKGGLIGFLGILQILGFYAFPIAYVILRVLCNGILKGQVKRSREALVKC